LAQPVAVIRVEALEHERSDTPVSVALPAGIDAYRPMNLVELTEGRSGPVAMQIEPGDPPSLWFVLAGKTAAGAERRFGLFLGPAKPQMGIELTLNDRSLDLKWGGSPLLSYNHAHVPPPEGVGPEFLRSGYIAPLYSPAGLLITEDFPADHHHHKGIWFPWTSTEFEGRKIDFWNLGGKTGTVQFAGFEGMESGPVYARFRVRHEHVDLTRGPPGKVALEERWDLRVLGIGGRPSGHCVLDLASVQRCASASPLILKQYRYGGLGYRGAKEWKGDHYQVLTSDGKTKADGHATRARWAAHSGEIRGHWTTVVLMSHPQNFRHPEPMRIWDNGGCFFNWAPVQAGDWTLEPGTDYRFRYRFYIHEGAINSDRAERAWQDFAHPPRVTVEMR
jgi:hypothetical protein